MDALYGVSQTYVPPDWAKGLTVIPKTRIKLAQLPTPIHKWTVPDIPDEFQLYIKRDDLTGAALSGNKIRKLEFIFGEALEQGCDTVITGGSVQSNHARATAMVAKELGMNSHLVLFKKAEYESTACPSGNLMLDCLVGAKIGVFSNFPIDNPFGTYAEIFKDVSRVTHKPCVVEVGAATSIGCWGYLEAFREMIEQGVLDNFDDIVLSMGAGGTACGLGIANYLTGSKLKIHGISIGPPVKVLAEHMDQEITELGLKGDDGQALSSSSLISMSDNIGLGYGLANNDQLKLLTDISTQTGIILDPTFTLKGYQNMLQMMKECPQKFKGRRILFLHTGGIFGLGDMKKTLLDGKETNKVYAMHEIITV